MKWARSFLIAAVAAVSASGVVRAATVDGSLGIAGAASTGTLDVTLTVPDLVQISNLNAITLADNGSSYSGTDAVCVYRNGTGNYEITASSGNGAGIFQVASGASTVEYTVDWAGSALTEATAFATAGASTTSLTCGGGTNVTVTLDATYTAVSAATSTGAHTDVLTLTVAPL